MMITCPSTISWATPRPATIRMSVATIGCTPNRATSRPLAEPATSPVIRAAVSVSGRPVPDLSSMAHVAPEIATTEPTDKSMPPVAMTSVMPSATNMVREPWVRMSIGTP